MSSWIYEVFLMSKKEVKKPAVSAKQKPAASGAKGAVSTGVVDKKKRRKVGMFRILVKCTNGKSFYTWSTCGDSGKEAVISLYSDPFIHEAWNKDRTKRVIRNDSFSNRYGSVNFD